MERLGDLSTRKQGEEIVRSSPDFEKQAHDFTKSLNLRGGENNG